MIPSGSAGSRRGAEPPVSLPPLATVRARDGLYVRARVTRARTRHNTQQPKVTLLPSSHPTFASPTGSALTALTPPSHNEVVGRLAARQRLPEGTTDRLVYEGLSYRGTGESFDSMVRHHGLIAAGAGGEHDLDLHVSGWGPPQGFLSTSIFPDVARRRFARPLARGRPNRRLASLYAVQGSGIWVEAALLGVSEHADECEVAYVDLIPSRAILGHVPVSVPTSSRDGVELTLSRRLFWHEGRFELHRNAVDIVAGLLAVPDEEAGCVLTAVLSRLCTDAAVAIQRAFRSSHGRTQPPAPSGFTSALNGLIHLISRRVPATRAGRAAAS